MSLVSKAWALLSTLSFKLHDYGDGDFANGFVIIDPNTAAALVYNANGQATKSNSSPVALPSDQDLGDYNTTLPTNSNGGKARAQFDVNSNLRTTLAPPIVAATDAASNFLMTFFPQGTQTAVLRLFGMASFVFNGTTWDRSVKPNAASRIASAAASTNPTSAKATAGNAHRVFGNNTKAAVIYLKLYNKATAPTVGTDTPVLTIPIPASAAFNIDIGGFYFATGIAYGLTTDAADNGTTALSSGDILDFTLTYA